MKNRLAHSSIHHIDQAFSKDEALGLILNHLEGNFFLVDRELRIVATTEHTRQRVKEYFGIDLTEGMSILCMTTPDRQPYLKEVYLKVFEGKEAKTQTEIHFNGESLFFEHHFKAARNERGEIVGAVVTSRDITETIKAESSLKEIEERWRFALEGSNQGVWDWNMVTGDVFYSASCRRLYGYEADELPGRIEEWEKMIHPDDKQKMAEALEHHLAQDDPFYESIYRLRTKQGNYKWIQAKGMLLEKDPEGKPQRMIGTHTDITRQVESEEKIRLSEQQYRSLFESNPLPSYIYDAHSLQFIEVNDAAVEFYGFTKNEFLTSTIFNIHSGDQFEELEQRLRNEKARKSYALNNWKHKKKNGDAVYVDLRINAINYKGADAMLVVAHDVTTKVMIEKELRKSNERFSYAAIASSEALWEWDVDTDDFYISQAYTDIFGWKLGGNGKFNEWHDYIHPEDRHETVSGYYATIEDRTKDRWSKEYRYRKSDGSYAVVIDKAIILRNYEGKAVKVIGAIQDISQRKHQEQLLSLERQIFEMTTKFEVSFQNIVTVLLEGIEKIFPDALTSVLLLKEDDTIGLLTAPRVPAVFSKAIEGVKIGPETGSWGASMFNKRVTVVENIEEHPFWKDYKAQAARSGLKACWSLPIIHSSGKVMGSLCIYYNQPKSPTTEELNTFERVRNILRILMEHSWSLNEIKTANERFDMMMKATHDLIWDWNLETNIIYRDRRGLETVYGMSDNDSIENTQKWLQRVHPDDKKRVEKMIREIVHSIDQDSFEIEYRFLRDDGTYSSVYDRAIVLRNAEHRPIRMIGAAQDVTERKRLEQELLQNELERQKAINQATVDTQENERTEIGKELHDNVNQVLTTTKLYLDLALNNPELKDELIQKSTRNILSVINEIRQLSRSLMDPTIGDLGLIDSIHDLIDNINLTRKLQVRLHADRKIETCLDKNHKLTIFRIIQETLNNAIRHAKATSVSIHFSMRQGFVRVSIQDDGIGFDPSSIKKGAGLKNIQNRIYLVNGTHSIESAPGKGCRININLPILKTHNL